MRWIDSLRADTVYGWRQIRKRKITSAAAILSLGLAIGACTSAFRLVDALLWRPLPIAAPDRLFGLSREKFVQNDKPETNEYFDYALVQRLRAAVSHRAEIIAVSFAERTELTFGSDDETEKAHVQYVSGAMFGSFGIRPALGRLLTEGDDDAPAAHPVAVLSHDYWTHRFGADTQVVGRTYRLGKNLFRVIGVAGQGFTGTEPGTVIDVFMPATMHWGVIDPEMRKFSFFRTFAHLNSGTAAEPVRDQLRAAFHASSEETLRLQPAPAGVSATQKNYKLSLAALGVLVALVLLIACANLANLMTAQVAARSHEMALRVSLGAGRRRLVQLLLAEGAMISQFATAIGMLFAWWAAPFIVGRINAPDNPARLLLPADWRVFGFAAALTFAVTMLFGLAPAWGASHIQPSLSLKGGNDPLARRRWTRALIAVQAAFCFLVLFVAGLFATSFERLSRQPVGFDPARLLAIDIVTPHHNELEALWDRVANRVRQVPGVESVGFSDWPLLDGYGFKTNDISVNGAPAGKVTAWFLNVSPGWMGTMRIPLIDGRDFRAEDASPGAAIVNETFAREFFGGANPVGKWFEGTSAWMRGQRFQVVGLVRDARYRYLKQDVLPVAYTPFRRPGNQGTMQGGTLVVRTFGPNPRALAATLRNEIPRAQPGFRVGNIRTQIELIEAQTVRESLLSMLALFFAGVALLLAGIGLYGVLDYSVLQRRREIGIRIAIGAQAGRIARLVTAEVFTMVLAGAVGGLGSGLALVRYVESLLYRVKATDPGMLALPSATLLAAALLAAVPAVIRAVRIDPVKMLRTE